MSGVSDEGGSHKKISNGLVAVSSAAVLAVYTAGYLRTKSAADKFAVQASIRSPDNRPARGTAAPAPALALPTAAPVTVAPALAPPARLNDRSALVISRSRRPATSPDRKVAKTPRAAASSTAAEDTLNAATSAPAEGTPELPRVVEQAPGAAPAQVPDPARPQYKDGTYLGWGTSRHGDIQAQVIIEGGRIASATIAQCLTRYSCSVIARLPPQVAERQSPEVDYVSGATQSTNAFYYAVVEALSKAK